MANAGNAPVSGIGVEISGISKSYGDVVAVRDVTLTLARGEILALLGPSGCGKSTLLRIVAGLEEPSAGEILIEGRRVTDLPPYQRPVNMMFQSYALFPHMTVEQNVAFGLRQEGMAREQIEDRIRQMLELVRMTDYRRRRPGQLSGGQQQRVALARSLAKSPKLLLLDEPMGALDRKLRADMQFELSEILRRVQVTCMIVTHDAAEAMVMSDRIALMREGIVVQEGPPTEVYSQPWDRFAAEFLGAVNFLPGRIVRLAGATGEVDVPALGGTVMAAIDGTAGLAVGQDVSLALRPEAIRLHRQDQSPPGAHWPVIVEDYAYLGTHTTFKVRLRDLRLAVHHGGPVDAGLDIGAPAVISFDPRSPRLLTN